METDLGLAPTDKSPSAEGRPTAAWPLLRDTDLGLFDPRCSISKLIHFREFEVKNPTTIHFHPVNCCMNLQSLRPPRIKTLVYMLTAKLEMVQERAFNQRVESKSGINNNCLPRDHNSESFACEADDHDAIVIIFLLVLRK